MRLIMLGALALVAATPCLAQEEASPKDNPVLKDAQQQCESASYESVLTDGIAGLLKDATPEQVRVRRFAYYHDCVQAVLDQSPAYKKDIPEGNPFRMEVPVDFKAI